MDLLTQTYLLVSSWTVTWHVRFMIRKIRPSIARGCVFDPPPSTCALDTTVVHVDAALSPPGFATPTKELPRSRETILGD
jgi:hypothetical protein